MPLRGISILELKRNAWYYGARCACGKQIVVAEDCANGYGNDLLQLTEPLDVECECGIVGQGVRAAASRFRATRHSCAR